MKEIPGSKPVPLGQLVRAQDRLTFVYLEHCVVHRDANAITARDVKGTVHIPAAALGALLLGPGTTVSQQAMVLLAESGSTAVWVGEQGVRYYAHGRSLARSSRLLEAQAALVSNQRSRLRVAREMYAMRFPGEDVSGQTMQQLRGRKGARVRRIYRENAERTGVEWTRRDYRTDDFAGGSPVNQALSAANTSLYGVAHAVIVALGCAPGLGFVHTGHVLSFVFDIADLYKADLAIPVAFDVAAADVDDIPGEARRTVRDRSGAVPSWTTACVTSRHCCPPRTKKRRTTATSTPTSSCCGTATAAPSPPGSPTTAGSTSTRPTSIHTSRTTHDRHRGVRVPDRATGPPHPVAVGDLGRGVRREGDHTGPGATVAAHRRHGEDRAIMVFSADNEQGLDFRTHKHDLIPNEIEGITLMLRPNPENE